MRGGDATRRDDPSGKRFVFTILDDTDDSTLENARPVYERLRDYGFRTTKTVWPVDCPEGSQHFFAADTLARREYLEWVKQLAAEGFEIAFHGATMESSERGRTLRALDLLERELGRIPRLHANHGFNRENLYWGRARFQTRPLRALLAAARHAEGAHSEGEVAGSAYFWGDVALQHFEYFRNFTCRGLDVLRFDPDMPYSLADTPYARFWFSTADAPDASSFKRRVSQASLERLEQDGGVCILSTHLGKGFCRDGRLDPEIDRTLAWLSRRPGWFAPVSEVLDWLRERGAGRSLPVRRRVSLETRFLAEQLAERLETFGVRLRARVTAITG